MKTGNIPRFDAELLTTGRDKAELEYLLHRVKGLASSPSEIVNSCPCTIAINISGGASKKLKRYLGSIGAKVLIRKHGQSSLAPHPHSSKKTEAISHQKAYELSGYQTSNTTQTNLVHRQAVPVRTADMSPVSVSPKQYTPDNANPPSYQVARTAKNHTTHAVTTTSITLKKPVNELLRSLQDKEWTTRELAVIELGEIPSDGVIRHIIKALKDDVWRVRYAALDVLSKTGSGVVIREIARCIHDDVWHVRYQAIEALSRMESDRVFKPLMLALDDKNWQVRQRAVNVLGDLRSQRTLGGVMACLRDDVWQVRESAAGALAKLRSDKSVKALIHSLHDPNWQVRSMVVTALWKIGSERAINALIDLLGDENWMVHWKAAYALGKIGTTNILPVLSRMEKQTDTFLSEVSQKVLGSLDIIAEPRRRTAPHLEYHSGDQYANMSYIAPGYFIMGHDNGTENARPAHQMFLEGFFIDTYEVTNYQYKRFNPSHEYPPEMGLHPVVNVTWEEANAYAEWIGKRLPTEAEWEKAARGSDGRIYPWGNEFDPAKCNTQESGHQHLTPVNQYPRGKSYLGVHDMIGNVLEWTTDRYKPYPLSQYDSPDFAENFIVLRGGSWLHQGIQSICSTRMYAPADNRSNFIGFRCVKDIK